MLSGHERARSVRRCTHSVPPRRVGKYAVGSRPPKPPANTLQTTYAPTRIRTWGLLLRRESLYPAELSGPGGQGNAVPTTDWKCGVLRPSTAGNHGYRGRGRSAESRAAGVRDRSPRGEGQPARDAGCCAHTLRAVYVAILVRRLREGKGYEDFVKAWYPDQGFGYASGRIGGAL